MPAPCTSHLVTSYIAELQGYTPVPPYLYSSDSFPITGDKVLHSTVTDSCTNDLGRGSASHLIFDLSLLSCQWLEKQNNALSLSGEERQCSILIVSSSNSPVRSAQCLHTPQQKSMQGRWMKLEPIIQSEVSQKEKHQYSILTHIYGI